MGLAGKFKDFSEWTSAHGLPHIGSAKRWYTKIFWLIIVVVCIFFLGVSVYKLIVTYLGYPTTVQTELKFKHLKFPVVTLCNTNPYRISEAQARFTELNLRVPEWRHPIKSAVAAASSSTRMSFSESSETVERLIYDVAPENASKKLILGHQLQHFVKQCIINGRNCSINEEFQQWYNPQYGNCFSFNLQGKYTTTHAGPSSGLFLLLNISKPEYMPTTKVAGVRVLVHGQHEEPFPNAFGMYAASGHACAAAHKNVWWTTVVAHHQCCHCQMECHIVHMQRVMHACRFACTCKSKIVSACRNVCGQVGQDACIGLQMPSGVHGKRLRSIGFNCKLACTSLPGSQINMHGGFARNKAYSVMQCSHALLLFRENTVLIEIFYDRLNYEYLYEVPAYEFVNLVSDFGGQLGLWLGFSIITSIEVMVPAFFIGFFSFVDDLLFERLQGSKPDIGWINTYDQQKT